MAVISLKDKRIRKFYSMGRRAPKTQGTIFDGAHNFFGELSDGVKMRILAFMNDPSSETWENCYSILVTPNLTLWKLWCMKDKNAQTIKDKDFWDKYPNPELLVQWIRDELTKRP